MNNDEIYQIYIPFVRQNIHFGKFFVCVSLLTILLCLTLYSRLSIIPKIECVLQYCSFCHSNTLDWWNVLMDSEPAVFDRSMQQRICLAVDSDRFSSLFSRKVVPCFISCGCEILQRQTKRKRKNVGAFAY